MIVSGAFSLCTARCLASPDTFLQKLNTCMHRTMVLTVSKNFIKPSMPIAGRRVKGTRTAAW